jgi:hypothetical protein
MEKDKLGEGKGSSKYFHGHQPVVKVKSFAFIRVHSECQAKAGKSSKLKGVYHGNCLFTM